MARVISFSSGKGGVGKTTLAANVGAVLSKRKRVLLIDGDWTLGKLSILFGVRPKFTIDQVLRDGLPLEQAVCEVTPNLGLLAAPSGLRGFEELTEAMRHQLFFEIDALNHAYDMVILDHSSGIHWGVLPFAAAAQRQIVVATCEPTSLTDAYAIMKVLGQRFHLRDFDLVMNQAFDRADAEAISAKFIGATQSMLGVRVKLLDVIGWEAKISDSIRRQKPFSELYPDSVFTKQLVEMGKSFEVDRPPSNSGLQFNYTGLNGDTYASKDQEV